MMRKLARARRSPPSHAVLFPVRGFRPQVVRGIFRRSARQSPSAEPRCFHVIPQSGFRRLGSRTIRIGDARFRFAESFGDELREVEPLRRQIGDYRVRPALREALVILLPCSVRVAIDLEFLSAEDPVAPWRTRPNSRWLTSSTCPS